jgi:hypothetical protein
MNRWVLKVMLVAGTLWVSAGSEAWALEFVAERVTRIDGHSRRESIYYRDNMWRVEPNDPGPVNIMIVRKDKGLVWLLLSRVSRFKTVNYEEAHAQLVSERLAGETAREIIGVEQLNGHPTVVSRITVATGGGNTAVYYQWFATDLQFPLRLTRKDADWLVEYAHVHVTHVSDFLFRLPRSYQPIPEVSPPVTP